MSTQIKIAHIITRLIIGGAQENTLSTVIGLMGNPDYSVSLITGPGIGPEGSMEANARKAGVKIIVLPLMRRAINIMYDSIVFVQLLLLFKREKFHIVHTHSSKAGILGRLAAYCARVPVIIHTIHGLPFHPYENKYKNWLYIKLEKICAKLSHKIITVSDTMRDKALQEKIGTPSLYQTIYSGMNIKPFINAPQLRKEMREQLNIKDSDLIIGKIARLFHLKGHDFVLECAPEIIRRVPDARFLFIGDGILKTDLDTQIKQLKLEEHFIFTGLVPPDTIPSLTACMDLLVHTSLREGLARALPQAMAAGVPVVTFDIDSAHEVVQNGINGYLIPSGDKDAFIEKVVSILTNPVLRQKLSRESQKAVLPRFDADYMVQEIATTYQELL